MIIIQNIILAVIGFAGGIAVAGGTFALITILGIIPRLAGKIRETKRISLLEMMIVLGGTVGSILTVYQIHLSIGTVGLCIAGAFAGVFVGSLSMALAECLKVIPVLFHRVHIKLGIGFVIVCMAIGKAAAAFYQLVIVH